jgi:hypothetical protein
VIWILHWHMLQIYFLVVCLLIRKSIFELASDWLITSTTCKYSIGKLLATATCKSQVLVLEYFDWLWCNSNIFLRSLFYFCCEFDIFWSLLFGGCSIKSKPNHPHPNVSFFFLPKKCITYGCVHGLIFQQALECLVRLASVRRSLFVEDPARSQFLSHLMSGTREILQTGQGIPLAVFACKIVISAIS